MGLRRNCINTFASAPVRWVNFKFANRMVAPIGFYLLAGHIANDRIKCDTNPRLKNHAEYDPTSNTIFAGHDGFGESYHDEKATLVHEGTHAMLDAFFGGRDKKGKPLGRDMNGKRSNMTILDDETIAYLAEAIYLIGAKLSHYNKKATSSPRDMALDGCQEKGQHQATVGRLSDDEI